MIISALKVIVLSNTLPQVTEDLVTFTEEVLNGKLHFLCSANERGVGKTWRDWKSF